jgi:hypothetical protein
MEAVDASKVAQLHAESPLEDAGILKQVLSYAGAGEWIFYAPISKLWLECYRAVPAHEARKDDTVMQRHDLPVVPEMTLRRAVYASAARVKLVHELGLCFSTDSVRLQFYTGRVANIAVLDETHRLGMPVSTHTLNGAAYSGELPTVIWLHTEHSCALDSKTSEYSAGGGHIEVLRWLKEQGMVFTRYTMNAAAMHGQIGPWPTCAYLHAESCPCDELTVYHAALAKHWDIVCWLHEHGCPWIFKNTCFEAAEQDEVNAMNYLLQQEPVAEYILSAMLNAAGACGHLVAAQWLRQRGAVWPIHLYNWSDDILVWARAEGCDSPRINN